MRSGQLTHNLTTLRDDMHTLQPGLWHDRILLNSKDERTPIADENLCPYLGENDLFASCPFKRGRHKHRPLEANNTLDFLDCGLES